MYHEGTPCKPHTRTAYIIDDLGNAYGGVYDGYGRFMTREVFKKLREIWHRIPETEDINERIKIVEEHDKFQKENSYTYNDIFIKMNQNPHLKTKYPNVVQKHYSKWVNEQPESCINQGYFY